MRRNSDRGRGIGARHFAQRHVGENHVGRHVARVGQRAPDAAELGKEGFVAFDFAGALFHFRGRFFDLLGEGDRRSFAERSATGCGHLQGGKFPRRDLDQTEPQQLAPERLPGVAFEFACPIP